MPASIKYSVLLIFAAAVFFDGSEFNNYKDKTPNIYGLWDSLLSRHVDSKGNVDYKAFKDEEEDLEAYLQAMAQDIPNKNWSKAKTLAFYINLYNAATVNLIIKNYPINSIRDIKNPWGKKIVPQNGRLLSLGEIEHDILRKMDDPRIHFAINCASVSCPKLNNFAFSEKNLEEQLEKVSKEFILDSTKNIISQDSVVLSEIFKWYKKDFETNGSVLEYLSNYLNTPIAADAKIAYLKYDWNLNNINPKSLD
ncbi:DUF547 domain-containing protein [Eudoraea chungangensis]|uniref:DUF547 domain-containing protein n=1 Tax=Eudoraea chungangensis TaxID=1481905 RepID=UPI0023EB54B3|nr:DUF547 domain-containing protein [Eudoraea chungangensis]